MVKMLKNYTTSINIEKSISEIESILAKHGATHIFKMYSDKGVPTALAFKCFTGDKLIGFKLPMDEAKILMIFNNAVNKGELQKRYKNDLEQARRTGWRIIKDWIDSQMALIEINLAKLEEIFLPYMYDERTNQTLFQKMEERT
jgi:hypothetical protein